MGLEIDANPSPGVTFLAGEHGPLFRYVIDRSNIVGPRAVTEADKAKYPAEWAYFLEQNPGHAFNGADPAKFDHDGKGGPGGAPKGGNRRRKAAEA